MTKRDCLVIAIAGGSGAGKTDLVNKLNQEMEDSSRLLYDHYKPDYGRLIRDLKLLKNGEQISYPVGNEIIKPNKILIIEDPADITDFESTELVDYMIYIDTPFDVSLTRRLLRAIYHSSDESIENFFAQIGLQYKFSYKEEPTKLMHIIVWLLENHLSSHRKLYLNDREKQIEIANLVLDGMKSTEEMSEIVREKLRELGEIL